MLSRRAHAFTIAMTMAQAACLFGLAACVVFTPDVDGVRGTQTQTRVPWAIETPMGCALGSSGPTLNPQDAIRQARLSAIEALAMESLPVDIQAIAGEGSEGAFAIASQALSGGMRDARIRALWAKLDPDLEPEDQRSPRLARVFALACWPDAPRQAFEKTDYPNWLLEPPRGAGTICALGLAGPTRNPADQSGHALRDARGALAVALESHLELRIFDVGNGVAKFAREIEPSPAALRRAETAMRLDETWMDESGLGPIRLPGVLYGLACVEH